MPSAVLPIHPFTGLTALGLTRSGRPIWPVIGASPDHDTEDGDDEQDDVDTSADADKNGDNSDVDDSEESNESEADDDAPLGPKGEKALAAVKAKHKTELGRRRTLERENAELKAKLDGTADDPATRQREAEILAKANRRIVTAEIRAAAAGKLTDPADALRFVDLEHFEVDDDGNVDTDDIAEAIAELIRTKPYLAAQGGKKTPKPDRRQGGGEHYATGSVAAGRAAYQERYAKK